MKPNLKAYREVVREHLACLESRDNAVMHNGRLVYVKRMPCELGGETRGVFALVRTRRIAREKLLPLYYMRDRV
jgi:hypothetical protein